jgi:hypothetical protein
MKEHLESTVHVVDFIYIFLIFCLMNTPAAHNGCINFFPDWWSIKRGIARARDRKKRSVLCVGGWRCIQYVESNVTCRI